MKYFYVYDYKQAEYFRKNNLQIVEIGKGSKNHIYIKFVRDDESEKVFKEWCNKK